LSADVAIDTNVLVRLLVRDDEAQFAAVRGLLERARRKGFRVVLLFGVMLEAEWVLRSRYKLDKASIIDAFTALLEIDGIGHEDEGALEEALLRWKDSSANFTDCMLAAKTGLLGLSSFETFDEDAARLPGARLLR
jgi:predicted nucleic-acid-binding protein